MNSRSQTFLKSLLTAPSPSGYETRAAKIWRTEAATFADDVDYDVNGNSYTWLRQGDQPVIVIEGHIDEIGFIITYIDPEGFLWFDKIGGWDDQVIIGQRVVIAGKDKEVTGVIGKKAAHLLKPSDREKVTESTELWIDIGASSRDEATSLVEIGDPVVLDQQPIALNDDLWASRSVDNRAGAYVALEALRLIKANPSPMNVVAVAATQEEIGLMGATNLAFAIKPLLGIAIDVTHATDYPGAVKKTDNDVTLGGGPVLTRGATINERVFRGLQDAALRLGITAPVQASGRSSGTDADAFTRSGAGIAAGLVSIPNRYMHSPNEVMSLSDLESSAKVIAEFVRGITPETDFRP